MDICFILTTDSNAYHGSAEHMKDAMYAFLEKDWQVRMYAHTNPDGPNGIVCGAGDKKKKSCNI